MIARCKKLLLAIGVLAVCCMAAMPLAQAAAQGASQGAAQGEGAPKPKNRVPGPAITPAAWPGGTSMPKGAFAIVNHVTYSEGEPYLGNSPYTARHPKTGAKVGPRSNELTVNLFKLRYGITDRLDIRTSTPFVDNNISRHPATGGGTWKGGVGDTTMMLRYQIMPRTDEIPFCVALDAGVILPTGHTGDPNKYTATNAFGVVVGGGASWINFNQRLDVDGRYAMYGEGRHGIQPGNYFLAHAHYAYALSRYFDLGAETSLRIEEERDVNGVGQKDSFTEWYAGPKMQIKIPEWSNLMIGAAVLFPVYRHYESSRLSTDARFEFRTGISF